MEVRVGVRIWFGVSDKEVVSERRKEKGEKNRKVMVYRSYHPCLALFSRENQWPASFTFIHDRNFLPRWEYACP